MGLTEQGLPNTYTSRATWTHGPGKTDTARHAGPRMGCPREQSAKPGLWGAVSVVSRGGNDPGSQGKIRLACLNVPWAGRELEPTSQG